MDPVAAQLALQNAALVPAVEGALPAARETLRACLEAGIPATLGKQQCCGKGDCGGKCNCAGGCGGSKVQVLVREEDVERVAQLLQREWLSAVEREGVNPFGDGGPRSEGEPPCPACGTAAPLVQGACSDCGLQLE